MRLAASSSSGVSTSASSALSTGWRARIAVRDAALMVAALTLGRLASKFDPPGMKLSW